MTMEPLVVGIGGTARPGSTSETALKAALQMAQGLGARTRMISATGLVMDAYEPGSSVRSANAAALVAALREADGVLIATPSYHGSMPGVLKNAIDYTEDMRADERPYLHDRAVGCIVCAEGAQAMGSTLSSLRSVIHALRGWPTPYAAAIDSRGRPFGQDGKTMDAEVAKQLYIVAAQVVEFARRAQLDRAAKPGRSEQEIQQHVV
jgi:FMN reductase